MTREALAKWSRVEAEASDKAGFTNDAWMHTAIADELERQARVIEGMKKALAKLFQQMAGDELGEAKALILETLGDDND